jgi:hypothetical protein
MFTSITVRTVEFPVPMDVQELMSVRTPFLTFKFLDPVECLIRLLTVGPLSANMDNLAFAPRRNYTFYEDFVDGERVKRIYDALRPGASALTSVLFFDSINRDKKGTYNRKYVIMSVLMSVFLYVYMNIEMYVVMYTVSNCSPSARVL